MTGHRILEIPDISRCIEIGKGSFGKVVLLRLGTDSQLYTVKTTSSGEDSAQTCPCPFPNPVLKYSTSSHSQEALQREIDIHHRINLSSACTRSNLIGGIPVCAAPSVFDAVDDRGDNANIGVPKRGWCIEKGNSATLIRAMRCPLLNAVIMPRMDSNLHRYLKWRTESASYEAMDEAHFIINQVQIGLKQLHSMNIIHTDLSTGNVLVRTMPHNEFMPLEIKISDFGNCRFVGSDLKEFEMSEYVLYMHPDQFTLESDSADHSKGGCKERATELRRRHCSRSCIGSGSTHMDEDERSGDSSASDGGVRIAIGNIYPSPKASTCFDAWSYGIMALDILMQYCRRADRRIDAWSRENQGLGVYKLATQDISVMLERIEHVANVFAMQRCKGDDDMRIRVENAWRDIITSGICVASQSKYGCPTARLIGPSLPHKRHQPCSEASRAIDNGPAMASIKAYALA